MRLQKKRIIVVIVLIIIIVVVPIASVGASDFMSNRQVEDEIESLFTSPENNISD